MGAVASRIGKTVGLLLVVPAFCGAALGGCLLTVGAAVHIGSETTSGFHIGRPHLKAIPVPKRACPYLKAVHLTSATAAAVWVGPDPNSPNVDWSSRAFEARLAAALPPLELSLRVAATQVPAPVRIQLTDAARQVALGRAMLATPHNPQVDGPRFGTRLLDATLAGAGSLANATDLVGNACGFPLAPDSEIF